MGGANRYDAAVIGGGVAGLAAAIRLAELDQRTVLIEGGTYPSHKVCGEFLSPEALPILERWGLTPKSQIDRALFFAGKRAYTLPLLRPAGSLSRYTLDAHLASRAAQIGVDVRTSTRVTQLDPEVQTLTLDSGETLSADAFIVGAGRLAATRQPQLPYIGFKAHFEGLDLDGALEMHLFPGAYLGLSNIENGRANVACIARAGTRLPKLPSRLAGARQLFDWMEVKAPTFGPRHPPHWPHTYFVGDAAGTIAPTCGDGLAMGLTSGILAAEHAAQRDPDAFRRAWNGRYRPRLRWGNLAHALAMRPTLANLFSPIVPSVLRALFARTREE